MRFKTLITQIKQLELLTDKEKFEVVALNNLSSKELEVWHLMNKM